MNCKPGDMAVIVSTLGFQRVNRTLGCIVKVVRISETRHPFGPMWDVEHREIERVADVCLRPIRPDGITTEEVKELFSPSPAKESEKV